MDHASEYTRSLTRHLDRHPTRGRALAVGREHPFHLSLWQASTLTLLLVAASVFASPATAQPTVALDDGADAYADAYAEEDADGYALARQGWSHGHRDRHRHDRHYGHKHGRHGDNQCDRRYRDRHRHDRYDRHRHDRYDRYDRYGRYDRYDRYDHHRGRPWAGSRYHRGGFYIEYGGYHGRRFDVPRRIARGHAHHDYHYGRDYHRGHGHYHEIYLFPSYYRDRVEYRPYSYCGGKLHARGHFDFRGSLVLDFEFNF